MLANICLRQIVRNVGHISLAVAGRRNQDIAGLCFGSCAFSQIWRRYSLQVRKVENLVPYILRANEDLFSPPDW